MLVASLGVVAQAAADSGRGRTLQHGIGFPSAVGGVRMTFHPVAEALARGIADVARSARTEEDLRVGVEALLRQAVMELGIDVSPRYEKTCSVVRGRSDAVYGQVVLEYEPVGTFRTKAGLAHACKQLEDYLAGEVAEHGGDAALRRAVGVGLDGRAIFFLRYRPGEQSASDSEPLSGLRDTGLFPDFDAVSGSRLARYGPYPVAADSMETLLLYLRSLRRRPLAPEGLAEVFGPGGGLAAAVVGQFYRAICGSTHPQVSTFYLEWDRLFGIVYGQDVEKATRDATTLATEYGITGAVDLKRLLFSVHTYYALLMKLLALELASLQGGALIRSLVAELASCPEESLVANLRDLEDGGAFSRLGIQNFLEGDFFAWYLSAWTPDMAKALRELARGIEGFEPATGGLGAGSTRDLMKKLYEYLVPSGLRHHLGEYYTPDWLAEHCLDSVGYDGELDRRVLDPACGSGTFLVLAIARARMWGDVHEVEQKEIAKKIVQNIVGFDLNPLAVIAARTNYLLALGSLVRYLSPLHIPVYFCDSVLTPTTPTTGQTEIYPGYCIRSSAGDFVVPTALASNAKLAAVTTLLEQAVSNQYTQQQFQERASTLFGDLDVQTAFGLLTLYLRIRDLEREGRDGLWARVLRNAFAPLFAGRFDYVVGNPPWVNWETLSDDYRQATWRLWRDYGLFSLAVQDGRLGGGKKDLSMLVVYVAADKYLTDSGRLGFLITQTVFKSSGAGDGFRRFRIGATGPSLRVVQVEDFTAVRPFEGAANRTALLVLSKGEDTSYPAKYVRWRRAPRARIRDASTLQEALASMTRHNGIAKPVRNDMPTAPWVTGNPEALDACGNVTGKSSYRAQAGTCTWASGVYWFSLIARRADGHVIGENMAEQGRLTVPKVHFAVEPDLIYPLLRGSDVCRWFAAPSAYILVPQDPVRRTGLDESCIKVSLPSTYTYLKQFQGILIARSGYGKYFHAGQDAFYSIYNVSADTFCEYKVVWPEVADRLRAAVVGPVQDTFVGIRPVVPDHTLVFVPVRSRQEGLYLSAVLNSAPVDLVVSRYIALHPSPHVLKNVAIPAFDGRSSLHCELALLGEHAHDLAARRASPEALREVQTEVDRCAADIWGIHPDQLDAIREELASG